MAEAIDPHNMISERLYRKDIQKTANSLIHEIKSISSQPSSFILVDHKNNELVCKENYIQINPFLKGCEVNEELKDLTKHFKDRISEIQNNIDMRDVASQFKRNKE